MLTWSTKSIRCVRQRDKTNSFLPIPRKNLSDFTVSSTLSTVTPWLLLSSLAQSISFPIPKDQTLNSPSLSAFHLNPPIMAPRLTTAPQRRRRRGGGGRTEGLASQLPKRASSKSRSFSRPHSQTTPLWGSLEAACQGCFARPRWKREGFALPFSIRYGI